MEVGLPEMREGVDLSADQAEPPAVSECDRDSWETLWVFGGVDFYHQTSPEGRDCGLGSAP